jgi:hypothetical protein
MNSFDYDILSIFEEYETEDKLTRMNIKSCREICQKYENKLYEKEMTSKILFFCQFDDSNIKCDYFNNIKIKDYEVHSDGNDDVQNKKNYLQKFNIFFGEKKCEVIFEMNSEFSDSGKNKLLYNKLFIDEKLIIKKESNSLKDFINLTYIKTLIENLNLETDNLKFLTLLLRVMNLHNMFSQILEKIQSGEKNYYHKVDWDSESDISMSDLEKDENSDNDEKND